MPEHVGEQMAAMRRAAGLERYDMITHAATAMITNGLPCLCSTHILRLMNQEFMTLWPAAEMEPAPTVLTVVANMMIRQCLYLNSLPENGVILPGAQQPYFNRADHQLHTVAAESGHNVKWWWSGLALGCGYFLCCHVCGQNIVIDEEVGTPLINRTVAIIQHRRQHLADYQLEGREWHMNTGV